MKNKVIISFIITIILILLLGFTSIYKMIGLADLTDKLYKHPYTVTTATKTIETHLVSMHRYMKDIALARNDSDIKKAETLVNTNEAIIYEQFEIVFKYYLGDKNDIQRSYNAFVSWKPIRDEVIYLMHQGKQLEASEITKNKGFLHVENLNAQVTKLNVYAQNKANFFNENAKNEKQSSIIWIVTIIIIVLILVFIILMILIDNITAKEKSEALAKKKKEQQKFLNNLRDDYSQQQSLKEICDKSINHIISYFKAINGLLYIFDEDNEKLYLGATYGIKYNTLSQTLDLHENMISENIIEKKRKIIDINRKINLGNIEVVGTKLITLPILEFEKSIGTIQLLFDEHLEEIDLEFLDRVVSLMATYIYKAQKDDESSRYLKLIDKNVLISKTDLDGNIIEVSEQLCILSKYKREELLGQTHRVLRHPDMPHELYEDMWKTITQGKTWKGELKNKTKDGGFYWISSVIEPDRDVNGNIIGYTAIRANITDKKTIEEIAITDGLTSLYNRRHFDSIFPKMMNNTNRSHDFLSFLLIDIDYFKQYNDKYGHQKGDEALKQVATVLKESLKRSNDFSFRLGGEEFGLLFHVKHDDEALNLSNKIKDNIENLHIEHKNNKASNFVTISAGLYVFKSQDRSSTSDIYKKTDEALYEAKKSGRNQIKLYRN